MEKMKDSMPNLDKTIGLPEEKISEFQKSGHTLIRNILSEEEVEKTVFREPRCLLGVIFYLSSE